jgi:acyl carrier protein
MTNTLEKLNQVFQDLFDDDELEVNRDTQAEDVEGWDSVTHVSLMIKVEKVFGFTLDVEGTEPPVAFINDVSFAEVATAAIVGSNGR